MQNVLTRKLLNPVYDHWIAFALLAFIGGVLLISSSASGLGASFCYEMRESWEKHIHKRACYHHVRW